MKKVALPVDKRQWHPSALAGQIVIISTVDETGRPNIAPKSWVTMVAFEGPILAFGCNRTHTTYANILKTSEFVVNVPSAPLVERIWRLLDHPPETRIERSGLTLCPAARVAPPLIADCSAHLECEHEGTDFFGDEVLLFGRIVAALVNDDCVAREGVDSYAHLRPAFFLEDGIYGVIDRGRQIGSRG
jgi:flavin reductase (DIM6/NTAB) family NADH-FMN oxidoreductase RutF